MTMIQNNKTNWHLTFIFAGVFFGTLCGDLLWNWATLDMVEKRLISLEESEEITLSSILILLEDKLERDKKKSFRNMDNLLENPWQYNLLDPNHFDFSPNWDFNLK